MNNTIGNFIDFIRVKWELKDIVTNPKEAKALAKLLKEANAQWEHIKDKLMEFTGHTSDFDEALEEMQAIREAVAELFDESQHMVTVNKKADDVIHLSERILAEYAKAGTMFAPAGMERWLDELQETKQKYLDTALRMPPLPAFHQDVIDALKPMLTGNKIEKDDIEKARHVYFKLTDKNIIREKERNS